MPRRGSTKEERKALGERLRATAKAAGYTSDRIAEVLGIEGGSVRGWWAGRNAPGFDRLKTYAEAVNVSIAYLIYGAERPMGPVGSLQEWRLRFGDLVHGGMDPAEAIDQISAELEDGSEIDGIPIAELTAIEREFLAGMGERVRETLNNQAGADWTTLSHDQRAAVLRLVETMAAENRKHRGA